MEMRTQMKLLVIHIQAEYIKRTLQAKFPQLNIHAAANESEVGNFIHEAEILLAIRSTDDMIKKTDKLIWIQSMISGVDFFVDLPSIRKDILITSAKGIHGPQMSEVAFLLMLALNRRFPENVQNQQNKVWERWPTRLLWQKKVGILGVGVVGQEIARKCQAFGMTVHGITSVKRELEFVDYSHGPEEITSVLKEVDYFINVLPSNSKTQNLIGEAELTAMKPTAFFINLGRGETVDEEAIIKVLKDGKIAGAALDVFCTEPLPQESPLWGLKNLIITPHVGGMSDIYVDQMLPIFEKNLQRFLEGERRDLINFIEW